MIYDFNIHFMLVERSALSFLMMKMFNSIIYDDSSSMVAIIYEY